MKNRYNYFARFVLLSTMTVCLLQDLCAQTFPSSAEILERISALQVKKDSFYSPGMFTSYRRYARKSNTYKADDNIFFTAISLFTLKQLRNDVEEPEKILIDSIYSKGITSFYKYRNQKGQPIYNFWQTDTPVIFPNSGWLNWFDKSNSMPNDTDDTVMILMALQANDSTAKQVHQLMQQHANLRNKRVKNTFKSYKDIPAYSTWFGKKMPVDFDVCVLANVLYFVQQNQLTWQKEDSASADLIRRVIVDKKYMTDAAYISPHYSSPAVIIYHFARLMGKYKVPALDSLKPVLINSAKELFHSSDIMMDKVILNTSLLRLGAAPEKIDTHGNITFDDIESRKFAFFIGDMATYLPNTFRGMMASTGIGKFYFYSPGYNNVLLLEYLTELKKRGL